ncbi:MAG: RNA polymerase sigma-70 factor [Bacteroidota bacterium]
MHNTSLPDINLRDDQSFEKLFRQYFAGLSAYAYKFTEDIDSAEEVVQNVFIQLWEKRSELNIQTSLKSYLFRAVHNRCLNLKRNEAVRVRHHQLHQEGRDDSEFHDPAIASDVSQRIYEAIGQLPPQRARIFRMSRFEALSYREIAEKLGLSPKTVEAQMGKALKQLRLWLQDLRAVWWILIIYFLE